MTNFKSHFKFNKQERSGIFFLLLLIVLLQIGYFVFQSFKMEKADRSFFLDENLQAKINSLKEDAIRKDSVKIYPFNPNFITDYKGYTLGMSLKEIDRLHVFRAKDNFANSAEDFQKVTGISDSLLLVLSPHFKFPEWTNKNIKTAKVSSYTSAEKSIAKNIELQDLNNATPQDLMAVKGIGKVLSERIVKYRNRLGGFLVKDQLFEVYFLEPEVAERVLVKFKLFNKPEIEKINVNEASAYEISRLVYIKYDLAKKIVAHRDANGPFLNLNELSNIAGFPTEKIDRIALYLHL